MESVPHYASDVAFSPTVKAVQTERGSRATYARVEAAGSWEQTITPELAAFIAAQTSFFLATANTALQPYIQHRGGPPGFLHVLDEHTLGFVDFRGNRQYVTAGNLRDNPKVCLFLIDYAERQRIKIWGEARIVTGDEAQVRQLMPPGYRAKAEHVVLIRVSAWDANCPQHIPQKLDASDVERALDQLRARIAALEAENGQLRQALAK